MAGKSLRIARILLLSFPLAYFAGIGSPGLQAQGGSASATFVTADTNTQGNWIGAYGGDGYDLANSSPAPTNGTLSYGSYALQSQAEWTYARSTSDKRALETDTQGDRVAATWYSTGSFSFDVNFTDTNTHQVALYVLDWDNMGRGETVTVLNASNPSTVLDSRSIPNTNSSSAAYTNTTSANFTGGTYLVWNISGHVTITITSTGFPNGVASGIFFGTVAKRRRRSRARTTRRSRWEHQELSL